ncbi:hypothetical protein HN481_01230 [Candidatus Parcubacteria bacterium]|jgi:hypothetical protein|nr:hypothetical protein [Candidatus Parcubacteria bacterium]
MSRKTGPKKKSGRIRFAEAGAKGTDAGIVNRIIVPKDHEVSSTQVWKLAVQNKAAAGGKILISVGDEEARLISHDDLSDDLWLKKKAARAAKRGRSRWAHIGVTTS